MAFEFISPEIDRYIGAIIVLAIFGFIVYLISRLGGGKEGAQRGAPGLTGERGPRGEPGERQAPEISTKKEVKNLEERIKNLEVIGKVEIKNIDVIIRNLKLIIEMIDEHKENPNAIPIIKQRIQNFVGPLFKNIGRLENELKENLRQLEEFEKKELSGLVKQFKQLKEKLIDERRRLSNGSILADEEKVIRVYVYKIHRTIHEAKKEFLLTKKGLEEGVKKSGEAKTQFINLIKEGIIELDKGGTGNAKNCFENAMRYMGEMRKMLKGMENIEKVKEKISKHELKDLEDEKKLKKIMRKISLKYGYQKAKRTIFRK